MVPTLLLISLSAHTAGCAQILGIEDLPPLRDSGSQPTDARPPVDGSPPIDSIPVTPTDGPPVEIDAMDGLLRRKAITIRAAQVEAPGAGGALTDFPVLVAVQDPQIMAGARQDEDNIYFVDADGTTRLAHEIEKWTPATNELVAWVKIPRVSENTDTVFYVYYGAPPPGGPVDPAQVWTNGYVAVWHLAEQPGTGAGGIKDSTNGNDGTAHASMQANDLVTGKIGDAIDFDGSDDEISFQNPLAGGGPHSISAWVNQRATGTIDAVMTLGEGAQNRARVLWSVYTNDSVGFGFYANDGTTNANIIDDDWTLLHWTYENRDNVIYVNAVPATARVASGVDTQGSEGRLGNATPGPFGSNMNLNGQLDEVRIATVVRPAEWVRTEFNNQSSPSSFFTVGPEETP